MKKTKMNFWLDFILLISFLISILTGLLLWIVLSRGMRVEFLGVSRQWYVIVHVIAGVVGLCGVVLHVVWHRDWLKALRGRTLKKLPKKLRANRIVDRVIWIAFLLTNIFGMAAFLFDRNSIVVSMADKLHLISGMVMMLAMVVHLVFHRNWIVNMLRRFIQNNERQSEGIQVPPLG